MKCSKSILIIGLALSTGLMFADNITDAQTNNAQKIKSVSEVKNDLREYIKISSDGTGCAGPCEVTRELSICSLVEDLDIRVRGKISGIVPKSKHSLLRISKFDLQTMRLIYKSCEPVATEDLPPYIKIEPGYKYKRFSPNTQELREIKKRLGLK
ncbi:hypothetical protein [Richelia sinica]|uniref:hypothetical protein n=1 Tax=Richelia sinica TaxID=1357545 RepID=UPI0016868320|nr:hypothetical protein [Richelia sinica]MBD2667371.1 hypothetical protein [Richelia sinica FACHB-800]